MTAKCKECGQEIPEPRKCCGTCQHWNHIGAFQCNGSCDYPLPDSLVLPAWVRRSSESTRRSYGRDCCCWLPRGRTHDDLPGGGK